MSDVFVIHWSDKHYIGHDVERGGGARERVIAAIMGGHVQGSIDTIDHYDTEEHTADDVTEDIALAVAQRVVDIGDPPSAFVRDFIEEQCGVGTAIPAQA
jgi:hypothetical protein